MVKQLSWHTLLSGEYAANTARGASMVLIALLSLVIYQVADTVWLHQSTPTRFRQLSHAGKSLPDIASWHLLGDYQTAQLNADTVPKTGLDLQLVGLMVANAKHDSQAIIAIPGEKESVYTVGDDIPGGAKIYKITADGVILHHDGKFESLRLARKPLQFVNQKDV